MVSWIRYAKVSASTHIKRAKDEWLEETIRLSQGENVSERALIFILAISKIFDGKDLLFEDPTEFLTLSCWLWANKSGVSTRKAALRIFVTPGLGSAEVFLPSPKRGAGVAKANLGRHSSSIKLPSGHCQPQRFILSPLIQIAYLSSLGRISSIVWRPRSNVTPAILQ